jgi:hypothetical protein
MSLPFPWQIPEVVEILGFDCALAVIHVFLVATLIQLFRKRRFRYALVALAAYAWALGSWSSAATGTAPMRVALRGTGTYLALSLLSQLIFLALTIVVIGAAWRRVQAACPTPRPAVPVDADAWLR